MFCIVENSWTLRRRIGYQIDKLVPIIFLCLATAKQLFKLAACNDDVRDILHQ